MLGDQISPCERALQILRHFGKWFHRDLSARVDGGGYTSNVPTKMDALSLHQTSVGASVSGRAAANEAIAVRLFICALMYTFAAPRWTYTLSVESPKQEHLCAMLSIGGVWYWGGNVRLRPIITVLAPDKPVPAGEGILGVKLTSSTGQKAAAATAAAWQISTTPPTNFQGMEFAARRSSSSSLWLQRVVMKIQLR